MPRSPNVHHTCGAPVSLVQSRGHADGVVGTVLRDRYGQELCRATLNITSLGLRGTLARPPLHKAARDTPEQGPPWSRSQASYPRPVVGHMLEGRFATPGPELISQASSSQRPPESLGILRSRGSTRGNLVVMVGRIPGRPLDQAHGGSGQRRLSLLAITVLPGIKCPSTLTLCREFHTASF